MILETTYTNKEHTKMKNDILELMLADGTKSTHRNKWKIRMDFLPQKLEDLDTRRVVKFNATGKKLNISK